LSSENFRLMEAQEGSVPWRKWGPYLSERQWGTVREDYSSDGSAWDYFTHDQARSRAYRWGEDGIAGICDDKQQLCFALTFWNGQDSILKERLFGLTNAEGNHGEDCKEYYFYLDNTPTHSYMKYLYKYPQKAYPYLDLVNTNKSRSRHELEYELINTGIFEEDRYFDIYVEYAKFTPQDILVQITSHNRGNETSTLDVLPTLWFRNTWFSKEKVERPKIQEVNACLQDTTVAQALHPQLGKFFLYCEGAVPLLFTDNETNNERLFGKPNSTTYVKDGINDYIVNKNSKAINQSLEGTKVAAKYLLNVPAKQTRQVRLRLTNIQPEDLLQAHADQGLFGEWFNQVFSLRKNEADTFYNAITPEALNEEEKSIFRQGLSGMLWNKQYYEYDVARWLREHNISFYGEMQKSFRNLQWFHLSNSDIISMPDKWEYPWYAAWDLAFHTVVLSLIDPDFAKRQLNLMLTGRYLHPNGQIPAYEWNFSDVNPPVHSFAVLFNYQLEQTLHGKSDIEFLESAFQKLLINFTWWVNRKDPGGRNVFQGGFLGLDNIGVFDRNLPMPPGVILEQADGTAWMAMYCQNMLSIALELAKHNSIYEEEAIKFFEHFLWIAHAMSSSNPDKMGLWDEEDGFFYDILRAQDGRAVRLKVRSIVGLISLCAITLFPPDMPPRVVASATSFFENHPELFADIHSPGKPGFAGSYLMALLNENRMRRILKRMLDEEEFLSPFGIRSLSRSYANHPYEINLEGQSLRIDYEPAESTTGAFGGNSNWRGPIWFPINFLIIRALLNLYGYYGNVFKVECPTGSGKLMNLLEVSKEIANRLTKIFLVGENGIRPVYGGTKKFQTDPYWKNNILFYEYFHGDNGAGLGASHQTGWTGLVSVMLKLFGFMSAEAIQEVQDAALRKLANNNIEKPQLYG
jgi:hypothetical protein